MTENLSETVLRPEENPDLLNEEAGVFQEAFEAMTHMAMDALVSDIEESTTNPAEQLKLAYYNLVEAGDASKQNEDLGVRMLQKLDGEFLLDASNFDFGVDHSEVLRALFVEQVNATTDRVDFHGNRSAEKWIGCGDLYPTEWDALEIDGEVGVRGIDDERGKVGYKKNGGTGKYLAVYTGGEVRKIRKLVEEEVTEADREPGIEYVVTDAESLALRRMEEEERFTVFKDKVARYEELYGVDLSAEGKAYMTEQFSNLVMPEVDLGSFEYGAKYHEDIATAGFDKPKMAEVGTALMRKKYGSIKESSINDQTRSAPPGGEMKPGSHSRVMYFGRPTAKRPHGRYRRELSLDKRWANLNGKTREEFEAQKDRYYEGLQKFENGEYADRDYAGIMKEICAMNGLSEDGTYSDIAEMTSTEEGRRKYVDACARRMARGEYSIYPQKVQTFREYAPFIIQMCHQYDMQDYIPWMLSKIRGEGGWNHNAALVDDVEDSHGFMGINMDAHAERTAEMGLDIKGNTLDNIAYGVWLMAYQRAKFGAHPQSFFMGMDRYGGGRRWKVHPILKNVTRTAKNVHYFVPMESDYA